MAPNTLPAMAKATANYANSALIKMEALADGYSEGIALDVSGNVSEGSGQNIFIVRDGVIYTPPIGASILGGITRDSIITLARDLGYTVTETNLPRELLYIADEVFCRRHRRRSDADPLDRQDHDRPGPPRADHRGAAARVLRRHQRRGARHARLADLRLSRGSRRSRAAAASRAPGAKSRWTGLRARTGTRTPASAPSDYACQRSAEDCRRQRRVRPPPEGRQLSDDARPRRAGARRPRRSGSTTRTSSR